MDKALNLAYRYLKFRSRTVEEMRRYLNKKVTGWKLSANEIEKAIAYLIDIQLLDDNTFVKKYVQTRNVIKPKSEYVLKQELKRLGVSEETMNEFFETNKSDQEFLAQQALKQKIKTLEHISDKKKRFQKAIQFLQRRGFTYSQAKQAYSSLF